MWEQNGTKAMEDAVTGSTVQDRWGLGLSELKPLRHGLCWFFHSLTVCLFQRGVEDCWGILGVTGVNLETGPVDLSFQKSFRVQWLSCMQVAGFCIFETPWNFSCCTPQKELEDDMQTSLNMDMPWYKQVEVRSVKTSGAWWSNLPNLCQHLANRLVKSHAHRCLRRVRQVPWEVRPRANRFLHEPSATAQISNFRGFSKRALFVASASPVDICQWHIA